VQYFVKTVQKNEHRRILFSDKKIFTIEKKFNRQNDRVYARSRYEAKEKLPRVQRVYHPLSAIVWWEVSYYGATNIHFCENGVKMNGVVHRKMLEDVVQPLGDFQQDSVPAHKAKITQDWLIENMPEFIKANNWPFGSPDLNPLD